MKTAEQVWWNRAILAWLISAFMGAAAHAQLTEDAVRAAHEAAPKQISAYVREILQDRAGNLWFGTNGDGVCRYDGATLTWFGESDGYEGPAVRGIVESDTGVIWFATNWGVSRYEDGRFTNYTEADGLSNDSTWSIMLDRSGGLWVGTHDGVCRFEDDSFVPFALPTTEVEETVSGFTQRVAFAMLEDRDGNLWFGTHSGGVHRYDGESFTTYTTDDGLPGNFIRCLLEDDNGDIWIGTDGDGAARFDGTAFHTVTRDDGLNNNRIYEIYKDSSGDLWFSTLGDGACRYDGSSFQSFSEKEGLTINDLPCPCGGLWYYKDCHGPNGAHVQEFLEDANGNFWFGCSGGLFLLQGETVVNVGRDGPWPAIHRADLNRPILDPKR